MQLTASLSEVWEVHDLEGMRHSEAVALVQCIAATKGVNMTFGNYVEASNDELGRRETHMVNFMPNGYCQPSENFVDLSVLTPTLWWYRPVYKGRTRLLATGTQLKPGYNIVNGYRSEANPTTVTNALNYIVGAVGANIYTGPSRGSARQRLIMQDNGVARPANVTAAAGGVARDTAVAWFNSVLGAINKVSTTIKNSPQPRVYFGAAKALSMAVTTITTATLKARQANDVRGYIPIPRGLAILLGDSRPVTVGKVRASDF